MSSAEKTTALLIDGDQIPGGGGTFATINPATEEVIGFAADGMAGDMDRAVAAARGAFDDTDWARDTDFRVHCLRQLRDALNAEIESLRTITVPSSSSWSNTDGAVIAHMPAATHFSRST